MSDGFYTPDPADVPRHSRWPWVIVALGVGVIVVGGVVFSSGTAGTPPNHSNPAHVAGSESVPTP